MSHFTTIKVQIKDGQILQQTLQALGYPVKRHATVRGFAGNTVTADYVIPQPNGFDLGFRQQGDNYELIADFWGVKMDVTAFINEVTQNYAHRSLVATVKEQGFEIEREETLSDGTVRVVVGRWA